MRPAIVFIDDIGFEQADPRMRHIRSVLDGGLAARPAHVRLYVTANRRHIVPRNLEEQASAINPPSLAASSIVKVPFSSA